MTVLILAEHNNTQLKEVTYHALTAALKFECDIDVLMMGWQCQSVMTEAAQLSSIRQVLVIDDQAYEHQLAERVAAVIALQAKNYSHILATSSTFSKNILPRAAALLDVGMVSEVVEIISTDTFVRPLFAGNVLATVQSQDHIKILTIRGTAFSASFTQSATLAKMEKINVPVSDVSSTFEKQTLTPSERPELTAAKIIFSGGRGLKSADNFKILEQLADRLGGAVGASRAAVDAGYAPNDYQIGQTGKVVAPDLYVAVGISGAIQHVAGMKDSKVIVAINNDPDAPIYQIADYVLVGDLFQILPALQAELDKQKVNK